MSSAPWLGLGPLSAVLPAAALELVLLVTAGPTVGAGVVSGCLHLRGPNLLRLAVLFTWSHFPPNAVCLSP